MKAELLDISECGRYAVPHSSIMAIKEFSRIIRRDRGSTGDSDGRKKLKAAVELAYVFHMADPTSPYAQYEETFRSERIIEDFFSENHPDGEHWVPDEIIEEAIEKYKELNFTPAYRLLESAIKGVHTLRDFFNDVDLSEMDAKGKPIYKPSDLVGPLKDMGKIVESLSELEKKIAEEQSIGDVNRGGVETNRYSD